VWGNNQWGQLGTGSIGNMIVPIQIGVSNTWKSIATGVGQSIAVAQNGSLWAWGNNSHGQLGNGTWTSSSLPIQIGNNFDWLEVNAAFFTSFGIKINRELFGWGDNWNGQIGDGTNSHKNIPILVCDKILPSPSLTSFSPTSGAVGTQVTLAGANLSTVTAVSIGGVAATVVSKTNTQLVATVGQGATTGPVSVTSSVGSANASGNFTVAVPSCGPFVKVASGHSHTLALKSDNTLWAFGRNDYNQLGDGTSITRNTPVQIGNGSDWFFVATGAFHSVALKSNGTLWAWG